MSQCRPKNNAMTKRANLFQVGGVWGTYPIQDACLVKSRRLQGETGQKGNRKATVALGRMERSRAELDRAEARLKQGYCREMFLAACKARKEFRDAEAEWNSYR